jgi:two-component system NtrC family sensor kinase
MDHAPTVELGASRSGARPRPPLSILWTLPLIAAIAFACTFNAAAWISRTYPGFFLWENGLVPAIGIQDDPAIRAGLLYQSRVVAVDGEQVATRGGVERVITRSPIGTPHRYTLDKSGTVYEITLPSTTLGVGTFALTLGNYLVNALVLLTLGVVVLFLEPTSRSARTFFVFCANYGLYLATSIDLVGPSWFQTLYFFLLALAPVTALQMVIDFPGVPADVTRLRWILPMLYGVAVVLGIAHVLAFHRSIAVLLALDRVTHLLWAAAFLGAIGLAFVAYRRPSSAAARERMRIFLLGLFGSALVPAIMLLGVYWTGNTVFPLNYLVLTFAVFPAAIAYAIARHDLFGVDRMIRQAVGYALVTVVIAVIYSSFLALVDYAVLPDLHVAPVVHVLVTMLMVVAFNPLRGRIQAFIDQVYFRAPYDYRTTVTAASQALASILVVDELVARLRRIVTEQMQVDHMEVWLATEAGDGFQRVGTPGSTLVAGGGLAHHLAANPHRPIHVALGRMGGRVAVEALADMVAIGAVLVVPLAFEQRLVGFLALGEKRSGRFYSTEDLDLLRTLANQAAVAVQNARAYRVLAETNRELREARDQLVEAERLAAIGELSAAVAHGIRNPLAGIKTAAELAVADAGPDDPLRPSFVDILSEADALESRISELLDFARPFAPNFTTGDLNEVVRGVLHLLRRQIGERAVTVDATYADVLPLHELDEAQIEQVCLALVTNALEAMPSGGTLTVRTLASNATEELIVTIRDTGHGIAPDQVPQIFRLFYTRKARGTGVGLATVKRIVDGHHGRIEVSSAPGAGTTFTVTLPLHPEGRAVRSAPPGSDATEVTPATSVARR